MTRDHIVRTALCIMLIVGLVWLGQELRWAFRAFWRRT